jgi:hypothetical protein
VSQLTCSRSRAQHRALHRRLKAAMRANLNVGAQGPRVVRVSGCGDSRRHRPSLAMQNLVVWLSGLKWKLVWPAQSIHLPVRMSPCVLQGDASCTPSLVLRIRFVMLGLLLELYCQLCSYEQRCICLSRLLADAQTRRWCSDAPELHAGYTAIVCTLRVCEHRKIGRLAAAGRSVRLVQSLQVYRL